MAEGDNMTPGEALWFALEEAKHIGHGNSFPVSFVQEVLGIKTPKLASKREFEKLALLELTAVDFVKSRLLDAGMWLTRRGEEYYIPLPSENAHFIDNMLASASRKIKRARILRSNTPPDSETPAETTRASRILMAEDSVKAAKRRREILK